MYLTQAVHRAAATPGVVATICAGRLRSRSEVKERVARFTGALRNLVVKKGDRVAVLALNSDRCFDLYFSVAWIGPPSCR